MDTKSNHRYFTDKEDSGNLYRFSFRFQKS